MVHWHCGSTAPVELDFSYDSAAQPSCYRHENHQPSDWACRIEIKNCICSQASKKLTTETQSKFKFLAC